MRKCNRSFKTILLLLAVMVYMAVFSCSALALADVDAGDSDALGYFDDAVPLAPDITEDAIPPIPDVVDDAVPIVPDAIEDIAPLIPDATEDAVPLTPDGNLTLQDDITGKAAEDKQFLTVKTKAGNTFYIIIDRASNTDNVYFLNLVDESDLMALVDDKNAFTAFGGNSVEDAVPQDPEPTVNPTPVPEKEATSTPTAPAPTTKNYVGMGITAILFIGGGAFLVSKLKGGGKKSVNGVTHLDEYDFGMDEDLPETETDPDLDPIPDTEPDFELKLKPKTLMEDDV